MGLTERISAVIPSNTVHDDFIFELAASGLYRINAAGRIETCRRWNGREDITVDWYVCDRDDGSGYLYVSHHMTKVKAHRLAWCLHTPGGRLEGLEINHVHVDRGTKDNRKDNIEKCGRHRQQEHAFDTGLNKSRGEQHRNAKLTEEAVIEMRKLRHELGVPYTRLAKRFNVTPRTAALVCQRLAWRHTK